MLSDFAEVVALSMATACIAFTVSETALFENLRLWLVAKQRLLGKLVSCGFCLSQWFAFGLVAIYRPRLVEAFLLLDYLLTAFIIAWLAAFQWATLCWLMDSAHK
jgi:hypothetical protein